MTDSLAENLRFGWTTGCCATAAACAAFEALATHICPETVQVQLPGGQTPEFVVAFQERRDDGFCAGIIKDAGDDPDATDGVLVQATISPQAAEGIRFHAGEGVGTVTQAGLPLAVGEPAINPKPREMILANLQTLAVRLQVRLAHRVTISIPNGAEIALQTWNPRLGILGGLSVLGTSGIVRPYSCSAWIHSIHRGVDVARANGWPLILASTGNTSEKAAQKILDIDDTRSLEMGDFAGATFKYLRAHPVPNVVIAGGFAKMLKVAQGMKNLHSKHSQVDFALLQDWAVAVGADTEIAAQVRGANTALHAYQLLPALADIVAKKAHGQVAKALSNQSTVRTLVFDREGRLLAETTEGAV